MKKLSQTMCEACTSSSTKLTSEEQNKWLLHIPDWNLQTQNQVIQLEKVFLFDNFTDAMTFANKITLIAETQNHHPAILIEWGKVTVTWWTHSIQGLHKNDFIMAAKSDDAYLN